MSDKQKCWWRYNNQGGRYMTCNYSQVGSKESRKKAPKPPKRITPEEFIDKVGKDYSDLTKAQKNEYHRLDMAERRAEVKKEMETIRKQLEFKKEQERAKKKKPSPKKAVGRPPKTKKQLELTGQARKDFIEDIESAYRVKSKMYSKERILKRLGEKEGQKIINKYKDGFFKSRN